MISKGQAISFDLVIGFSVFVIIILFSFWSWNTLQDRSAEQELAIELQLLSDHAADSLLLTPGRPVYWDTIVAYAFNTSSIDSIGLTSNSVGVISVDKMNALVAFNDTRYTTIKTNLGLLGPDYEFLVDFYSHNGSEYILNSSFGVVPSDAQRVSIVTRSFVFDDGTRGLLKLSLSEGSFAYVEPILTLTVSYVAAINSFSYDVSLQNVSNNFLLPINTSLAPYDSLAAYWSFDIDDSSTAYDISGNELDAGYTNAVTNESCDSGFGYCASFDGTGDFIDLGTDASLTFGNGIDDTPFTFMGWVYMRDATNFRFIQRYSTPVDREYIFGSNGADKLSFYIFENGWVSDYEGVQTTSTITSYENTWIHIAAVYDGRGGGSANLGLNIYINGSSQAVTLYGAGSYDSMGPSGLIAELGRLRASSNLEVNGNMDEVMIFNTNLSTAQISAIYNNQSARFNATGIRSFKFENITTGYNEINISFNVTRNLSTEVSARVGYWDVTDGYDDVESVTSGDLNYGLVGYWHGDGDATDSSGNGHDGTLTAGATADSDGVFNSSFHFDGADDIIPIPNDQAFHPLEMSVSAWVYLEVEPVSYSEFFEKQSGNSGYALMVHSSYKPLFYIYSSGWKYAQGARSVPLYTWTHLVMTHDGVTAKVYMDGEFEGSSAIGTRTTNTEDANIGGSVLYASRDFDGFLDEVMIWNRSLTEDEIEQHYTSGRANWVYPSWVALDETGNASLAIDSSSTHILPEIRLESNTYNFYTPVQHE